MLFWWEVSHFVMMWYSTLMSGSLRTTCQSSISKRYKMKWSFFKVRKSASGGYKWIKYHWHVIWNEINGCWSLRPQAISPHAQAPQILFSTPQCFFTSAPNIRDKHPYFWRLLFFPTLTSFLLLATLGEL